MESEEWSGKNGEDLMPYSYKECADFLPENATNWHQGASLTSILCAWDGLQVVL